MGFTLAEVLITLGIIGVVASLTIPTLIQNHQKQVTVNGLKKVYSDLANIIRMSEIYNGEMSQWDFPQSPENQNPQEVVDFLNKYYAPYAQGAKVYTGKDLNKQDYYFYNLGGNKKFAGHPGMILSNGTIITLFPNIQNGYIWLFADINGFKKPNKVGRDVFVFDAYKWADNGKYRLKFWGDAWNRDSISKNPDISEEEQEENYSYYECNRGNKYGHYSGWYCGAMIQKDGWKISDDYPW